MINVNNKGFTLIELLVTITLLAIITTISFVSINSIIEESKRSDCKNTLDGIKSAAGEYVSDNRYKNSFVNSVTETGNVKTLNITAEVLTTNNYLTGDIVNPFTKEVITPSTLTIALELYDDYTLKTATINGLSCE